MASDISQDGEGEGWGLRCHRVVVVVVAAVVGAKICGLLLVFMVHVFYKSVQISGSEK